jgi:hypothetical protein
MSADIWWLILCGSDDDSSGFSLDGICYCSSVEWRERWEFFNQIEFDLGTKFCWMDFCVRVFPKLFLKKLFFLFPNLCTIFFKIQLIQIKFRVNIFVISETQTIFVSSKKKRGFASQSVAWIKQDGGLGRNWTKKKKINKFCFKSVGLFFFFSLKGSF